MIEIVYKVSDNPNTVTFKEDGVAIDFSAATRMTLELSGLGVVADSDVDADLFDWSQGSGVVEFNLNDLDIAPGKYSSTVRVFDPAHADGQRIADPSGKSGDKNVPELVFQFVR